jgi:hypothetical protein
VTQRDDRVLLLTRLTAAAVAVVVALGSTILLVYPDETGKRFAWKIGAQMTSMLLGAAYASGLYYFLRMTFARRWHTVGAGLLSITGFATLMEIATIIHWDVFIHGRFAFRAWFVIYTITPFLVPLVWALNRRRDPGTPSERDATLPPAVRYVLGVWGAGSAGMAAFTYLAPHAAIDIWPWPLTPLTSRVIGAWFVMGTFGLVLARDNRWSSLRIAAEAIIVSTILILVGVARTWDEFDTGRVSTYLFLAAMGFGLVFLGSLHVVMERRARASVIRGEPLSGAAPG